MKDTKEIIKCPACGEVMEKISISGKNFKIDVCTQGCGGIFFDNREFEHFDEQHENIEDILLALEGKTFKNPTIHKHRICPNCLATMVTNGTVKSSCIIDVCYSCGGKFLDGGELEKIRNEFKSEAERSEAFNSFFIDKYTIELTEETLKNIEENEKKYQTQDELKPKKQTFGDFDSKKLL